MNTYFTFPYIARATKVQLNAPFFYCFNFVVRQILKNVVGEILSWKKDLRQKSNH